MSDDDAVVATVIAGHRQELVAALTAATTVAAATCCLALGGGYGRGEGGIRRHADGRCTPHNDYDLVLVHRPGTRAVVAAWCHDVHRRFSPVFGLHVDVTPLEGGGLAGLPQSLTWYEFGQGHVVWWGDGAVLAPLAARRLDQVDPWEWGRLLVNRSAGVVCARWRRAGHDLPLGAEEDPVVFATRQVEKAWLALGDVWLADRGLYHDRLAVRSRTWAAQVERPAWAERWEQAAAYKRRPRELSPEALAADLDAVAPLLVQALADHACAPLQPLRDVARTLVRVSPSRWCARAPWAPLRNRVRCAFQAELSGDSATRQRLIGTPAQVLSLWSSVA